MITLNAQTKRKFKITKKIEHDNTKLLSHFESADQFFDMLNLFCIYYSKIFSNGNSYLHNFVLLSLLFFAARPQRIDWFAIGREAVKITQSYIAKKFFLRKFHYRSG